MLKNQQPACTGNFIWRTAYALLGCAGRLLRPNGTRLRAFSSFEERRVLRLGEKGDSAKGFRVLRGTPSSFVLVRKGDSAKSFRVLRKTPSTFVLKA